MAGLAFALLVLSDVWKQFGWSSVIYLAALTQIDPHLIEAAAVDAAEQSGSAEECIVSGHCGEDEAFFDAMQARRQPANDLASARQPVEIMRCLRERRPEHCSPS